MEGKLYFMTPASELEGQTYCEYLTRPACALHIWGPGTESCLSMVWHADLLSPK